MSRDVSIKSIADILASLPDPATVPTQIVCGDEALLVLHDLFQKTMPPTSLYALSACIGLKILRDIYMEARRVEIRNRDGATLEIYYV